MADTKTSALTSYTNPLPDDLIPIVDVPNSTLKQTTVQNLMRNKMNYNTSSQNPFSSDTYLVGSNITIPTGAPDVGTKYRLIFDLAKTNAGTATPVIIIRFGTNGSTADTARLTFTFGSGTAAADTGRFEVLVLFRTVGSGTSAVMQGSATLVNNLTTTGISNAVKALQVTSAGFDSTVANSIIGASYNGGASASHTVQLVEAELIP